MTEQLTVLGGLAKRTSSIVYMHTGV